MCFLHKIVFLPWRVEHEKCEGGAEKDDGQVTFPRSVVRNVGAALFASL